MCPKLAVQRDSKFKLAFAAVVRSAPQILTDVAAWVVAVLLAQLLVLDLAFNKISGLSILWVAVIVSILQFGCGWLA
jgi:hypothetical protein